MFVQITLSVLHLLHQLRLAAVPEAGESVQLILLYLHGIKNGISVRR